MYEYFLLLVILLNVKPMSNVNDTTNHLKYICNHEYLFVTYRYMIVIKCILKRHSLLNYISIWM